MSSDTIPALFRFQFTHSTTTDDPSIEPKIIEHTQPVPLFLTRPDPAQRSSPAFTQAFIDVLSVITHQHHDECMAAITSPCPNCNSPATDLLKSPISYLHLAEPMVIVHLTPVCGKRECEAKIRTNLTTSQRQHVKERTEEVWSGKNFGAMSCDTCGSENAKRCAGCGTVAYCSKDCQKAGWKGHKRYCTRRGLGQDVQGVKAPVDTI